MGSPHTIVTIITFAFLKCSYGRNVSPDSPRLTTFAMETNIQFRYARTSVHLEAVNPSRKAQQFPFSLTLLETAFVMNMSLTYNGVEHVSKVEEKKAAEKKFQQAVSDGRTAAQVKGTVRDAQKVSVDVNIEPGEKVVLVLTYEELLKRKVGRYEYSANINPGSIVDNFTVTVHLEESLPIKDLLVPDISDNTNDIGSVKAAGNSLADVQSIGEKAALITYIPTRQDQEGFGSNGINGKFVVEYDVERHNQDNIVQVMDGYFVHFFAPDSEGALPKHIIFVLDTSGSMLGTKMEQLKNAMVTILEEVTDKDFLSIITFSDQILTWRSEGQSAGSQAVRGTRGVRNEASRHILQLVAKGGTDINNALLQAVQVANNLQSSGVGKDTTPIIVFLTDGEATSGEDNPGRILKNVVNRNIGREVDVPIFSLALGADADFKLLRDISLKNLGFAKKIYEGTDAAIQLEGFYQTIATPLLKDVKFEYVGDIWQRSSLSEVDTPTFFNGSETIVVGKLNPESHSATQNGIKVIGKGVNGNYLDRINFDNIRNIRVPSNINFMERLWAYMTIKRLLAITPLQPQPQVDPNDISSKGDPRKEALDLSLKYNFVTELTSLIVTKPGEEEAEVKPVPVTTNAGNNFHGVPVSSNFGGLSTGFIAGGGGGGCSGFICGSGSSGAFFDYDDYPLYADDYYDISGQSANGGIQVSASAPPRPTRHTTRRPFFTATTTTTTTTTSTTTTTTTRTFISSPSNCNITMYSKTYNRGESETFTGDQATIGDLNNRLVSLRVNGNCCWRVFTEENYRGKNKDFCQGVYNSATDVAFLFKDASSLKFIGQNSG